MLYIDKSMFENKYTLDAKIMFGKAVNGLISLGVLKQFH